MFKHLMTERNLKAKLMYAFKQGEICKEHQSKGGVIPIYPKIQYAERKGKEVYYIFTLPSGMDPQTVHKKKYVFQQIFGEHIELEGGHREFQLRAYSGAVSLSFPYSYEHIEEHLKNYHIPIYCGYDKQGNIIIFDLITHPHLITAGETGSGKSSFLRVVLCTLIQYMNPDELRLVLGDLKRMEFGFFRGIAHVDSVHMNAKGLLQEAKRLKKELERRGELFDTAEVVHIDEYNEQNEQKLPYVIFAIDEVALLQKENELMNLIEDISAIGRALGIFLLLSMQRPDKDVLDGKLKNNCTVRSGFRCSDDINSRIIGVDGCEALPEPGRMILKIQDVREVQCPFLSAQDARNILKHYKTAATYTSPQEKETLPEPKETPQIQKITTWDDES